MIKQQQIVKEFKADDSFAINQSNRDMEKQGYQIFNKREFKKRSMKKTMRRSLLTPALGLATGFDKWVRITYRLKPGEKRW